MAGRYGVKKLLLRFNAVKVDDQKNLLVVKGSGAKPGSIVDIKPNNIVVGKGGSKS